MALIGIIGKIVLGPLSDRLGRIWILVLCGILLTLGSLGIAFSRGYMPLMVSTALLGLGYGAVWPIYASMASDFFPKGIAGSVVGLWTLKLGMGSTLAPILGGYAVDVTGTYTTAFLIAFSSAILATLLLVPLLRNRMTRSPVRSWT
jgi:DHA1 family bicyclomycin/chloramphenicol resistance-like MFS transporter